MAKPREVPMAADGREIVEAILAYQNPDGGFVTPADVEHLGEAAARSGYLPKYRGTTWQAIFLAQLGADPADPRVAKLCRHILDGDFSPPTTWPYQGSRERCFSAHSCFIGVTQAMKAMTSVPPEERTGEVADFIRRGTDFILLHRVFQQSRGVRSGRHRSKSSATAAGKGLPIKKFYLEMGFPLTYFDDVLGILETLLLLGVKDPAMENAVQLVLSKRTEVPGAEGAARAVWPNERPVPTSKMWAKIEGKTKASPWNTQRALRVLKMWNSGP